LEFARRISDDTTHSKLEQKLKEVNQQSIKKDSENSDTEIRPEVQKDIVIDSLAVPDNRHSATKQPFQSFAVNRDTEDKKD